MSIDETKLNEMLGRFVGDLGATIAAGSVVVGHNLGLYRALATGPATAAELAERTGTDPRYLLEWLRGQAAGGYVTCAVDSETYSLSEEQAFVLANPTAPCTRPAPSCWPWARCARSRASPRRCAPGPAWVGTSTTPTSSPDASSSSARATSRT